MCFTMGSHESARWGEKRPYGHFALPKTRDPDPSSYLPNSLLGTSVDKGKRQGYPKEVWQQ